MPDEAADLGLIEDEGGTEGEELGGDEEETPEGEPEGEPDGEGEGERKGGPDEGEEPEGRAGRALPTQLRKAVREFVAGNPEFAKKFPQLERQLTAAMFKAGQADRLGGLQALRGAHELLETHGGAEGIQQMAEEVEASRMMEEGFAQGDPVVLDSWSKEYPEGFKAMVGPAIEKLEALDLAAHDRALSGPMFKTLDRCGVIQTVNALDTAIAGEQWENIQKHFGDLKNFLIELRGFATKAKAPDPLKADRDALAAEREEIQTERQKTFYGGVRTNVNTQVMAYTNKLLRQELAGKKLRVETANRVRKQINEDLATAVNTAPGYAEKYKAIMNAGDHNRAAQFIVANARQRLPQVIKRVLRDFNLTGGQRPGGGAPRRVAGSGGPRNNSGTTVTGRPKTADVDFTRTDKARYLASLGEGRHGQAYLRNGKVARW